MLRIGIYLEACGIKCTEDQAKKVEAFVNHFVKKHFVAKKDLEKKEIEKKGRPNLQPI